MSQKDFAMQFDFPTSWRHGRGLAAETGRILKDLGCKKTLLVTDRLLVDLGVITPLPPLCAGRTLTVPCAMTSPLSRQ